ncbi:alpha/beta hydrolase family protein [Mycolicibacterium sp. 050232]|uniref:alpha/beta hydrolase family protein n=1 Tax=Mycolicibacterium sp. 050232 TaxID=3113982 RepID=UPI002E297BDC|nr:alpha/beta hydrolase family protein [Mycolicibacterium sp. 050232]MED5814342.1 alpha/beta hydrolase family protein [Mycolicibacterium sp. 050232]
MTDVSGVQGVPTWFGPEQSRLFGVLHVPEGGVARAGVVICPPLGRQYQDSYRGLKLLAQELCAKGFAVLRFDYRGTGDSTGNQCGDGAVDGYVESIGTAVSYIRAAGVESVCLVGLGVGALLAATAVEGTAGLVLWDPVTNGRRYVREQQALYRMTVAAGESEDLPPETGAVPLVGITLSAAGAKALGALKIPASVGSIPVLVLPRPERADDRQLADLVAAGNCTVQVVSGQPEFVEPPGIVVKIPLDTLAVIASWLDANLPTETVVLQPVFASDAEVGELPDGRKVVESITALGPNRLFAIRSAIAGAPDDGPTVLLHTTASDHRVGTGRLWSETSRELAALGVRVFRYDRRGVGDTGIATDEYAWITSADAQADVMDAVDALAVAPDRVFLTGICSGAWNSALAGLRHGARSLVLVNLPIYSWRRIDGVNERLWGVADFAAGDSEQPSEQPPALARAKQWVKNWLPYRGWLILGRLGYTQVPEVLFKSLGSRGLSTELVMSPLDYGWFSDHQGPIGFKRLARHGLAPRLTVAPGGDHAVLHRGLQNFIREHLVNAVRKEFADDL